MKNSKSFFKRTLAALLVAVMLVGMAPLESLTGIDFGGLFGIEAEAAESYLWPVPGWKDIKQSFAEHDRTAIDIGSGDGIKGKDVVATKSGTILHVWYSCTHVNEYIACPCSQIDFKNGDKRSTGHGNGVVIKHNDGTISNYAHLQYNSIPEKIKKIGAKVNQGELIGKVGSSGLSSGYHLHFSISSSVDYYTNYINNNPKTGHNKNDDNGINYIYSLGPTKPTTPKISVQPSTNVAVGTPVTIYWSGTSNTSGYKVFQNGAEVQNKNNTDYSFKPSSAGTYSFYVQAYNSKYTPSDKSNTVTITAHNPSTVTFVGLNGKTLRTQEVDYGKDAIAPDIPTEEGYTFLGWDKAYSNITQDTTVTAKYKINTYNIKFVDRDGISLSEQVVEYGSDAVAPVVTLPDGYVFLGWDSNDYISVRKNAVIKAIGKYGNPALPIITTITSAARQDDGYYVIFNLSNYDIDITRGRAVVSLKTAEGKLVDTTESAAFSIPKNGVKTGMEVFIPCDKAATTAEVIIVNSYPSGVPISENVSAIIDQGRGWSNWVDEIPAGQVCTSSEERTEYRYQTKTTTESYAASYEGYTQDSYRWVKVNSRTENYANFPAGFSTGHTLYTQYHITPTSASETAIKKVTLDSSNVKGYIFWHWCRGRTGLGGPFNSLISDCWTSEFKTFHAFFSTQMMPIVSGCYYHKDSSVCEDSYYWFPNKAVTVYTNTYSEYNKLFTYSKWNDDWSEWSTTPITETDLIDVETKITYRYKNDLANVGVEDNSGVEKTVLGTLDVSLAGKQATLYVYKIDEASDWTNEYVGQGVIGADGSYSFTFKLREEPTIKTGDFTVALGVEGSNGMTVIDTIEAPVAQYAVKFYDYNGNIVKTETVPEFGTAVAPENPTREGYDFLGWDNSLTNVKCDLEVAPRFVKKTYIVVFVNWTTQTIETKSFEHGDFLTGPEIEPVKGTNFTGWSGVVDGTTTVTSNMIITAEYTKDNCEIVFYDFDGNAINTQNVDYGDSIIVPDDLLKENYIFLGWASDDGELNFGYADGNKTVYPVYVFEETVATPTASVATGTYNAAQTVTLTCETEDAVIYYTTDGSNPLDGDNIYTQPLTIDKSTQLKFAACAFEMNDSEIVSEFYAINTDNMTSGWMAYSDIPQYVLDDIEKYSLGSNAGYRYKDIIETATLSEIESLLASGWTDEGTTPGITSDWSLEMPVIEDLDYAVNEQEPDPVPATHYKYSHFKYYDDASQSYKYSNVPIDGISGETEEITLASILNVSGFMQGTTTPYFTYNGEQWFTQTPVTVYVPAGYMMYSYTTNVHTLSKWTDWSLQPPAEGETREIQSDTVYRYTIPEYRVVTIVSYPDQEMRSFFAVANEVLDIEPDDYTIEGHSFDGLYTDTEFTTSWSLETDIVTQDIMLYAKNAINTYSVTFKNSDGTVLDIQQVEYMSGAQEPVVPVDEGYVHVGWDTEDYLCVVEDLTVTARVVLEEDITKVTLSRGKYSMMEGSYYKLLATVTPEDLEDNSVVWTSSDYDIIDVDQNGNVYAVSAGTATVTAVAFDGTAAECVFTVIGNPDNFVTLKPTANYTIDDAGYIRGVVITTDEAADTHLAQTVAQVKAQFVNDNLVFTDINGNLLEDSDLIGTGTRAAIMNGDNPVDTVNFIVTGDTNGDGAINNRDAALATRYLVDKEAPNASQMIALDVNGDGYVNNRDASMLSRYLVGKEVI